MKKLLVLTLFLFLSIISITAHSQEPQGETDDLEDEGIDAYIYLLNGLFVKESQAIDFYMSYKTLPSGDSFLTNFESVQMVEESSQSFESMYLWVQSARKTTLEEWIRSNQMRYGELALRSGLIVAIVQDYSNDEDYLKRVENFLNAFLDYCNVKEESYVHFSDYFISVKKGREIAKHIKDVRKEIQIARSSKTESKNGQGKSGEVTKGNFTSKNPQVGKD